MRRLIVASAFGAALLMSSAVFAQVPADANNPNENLPDAMAPPAYGETINIETAKKAAAAAIAEAQKRNWNALCVAIVAPSGDLVYFEKQDNVSSHRFRFRNTRHAPRRATGVRPWCSNVCSARATFSPI
jgi:glc operon protein GlcG